jgi:hypothetical protein
MVVTLDRRPRRRPGAVGERSGRGNWKTALVALALISAACSRQATRAALEIDPARLHAEVTPRSWTLFGPFPFSADDLRGPGRPYAGLNHDFLADLGKPEAGIHESDLATLPASRTSVHQDGAYFHYALFPGFLPVSYLLAHRQPPLRPAPPRRHPAPDAHRR